MNPYCQLAKEAVKNYLENGSAIEPPGDLPENFYKQKSGVFVTIEEKLSGLPRGERKRALRGCIGTYLPTKANIAQEIIANAIAAATQDARFLAVTPEELDNLSLTVSLLSEPEPIDSLQKLDPKTYGLIVRSADSPYKCGLLLPDLEGIDTAQQQFLICCQKGGVDPGKDTVALFRFRIERHKE